MKTRRIASAVALAPIAALALTLVAGLYTATHATPETASASSWDDPRFQYNNPYYKNNPDYYWQSEVGAWVRL